MSNSDSYNLILNTPFNATPSSNCISCSGSEYNTPGITLNQNSFMDTNNYNYADITFGTTVLTEELLIKLQALVEVVENHPELSKELNATLAFRKLKNEN